MVERGEPFLLGSSPVGTVNCASDEFGPRCATRLGGTIEQLKLLFAQGHLSPHDITIHPVMAPISG
ncbi:Uncharacterised protein [Mycobacterium tuberculosis]|nr:Uncharacterised protein [Mycobacterium tuberculosis]CPB41437.1 Uncharacterised protein [Mycobacterium tuberculosis]SGP04146.1 Uncharacterised protein [Mycobacterium tuberculosis]